MGSGIVMGNKNPITRDNVAMINRFMFGDRYCLPSIIGGNTINFDIERISSNEISIKHGFLYAYGYFAYLKNSVSFTFENANTVQNWIIYAEIDLSKQKNEIEVKKINIGRSTEVGLRQDYLTKDIYGVFQVPLYRISVTKSGIELPGISDIRPIGDYYFYFEIYTGSTTAEGRNLYTDFSLDKNTGVFHLRGDVLSWNDFISYENKTCYFDALEDRIRYYKIVKNNTNISVFKMLSEKGSAGYSKMSRLYNVKMSLMADKLADKGFIASGVNVLTQPSSDRSTKVASTEFVYNIIYGL